ncbi:hypothetical protein Esti_000191 [Eimeria stiedai]
MVMHRVRATSYVRRTLSQPMSKRRITAALAPHEDGSALGVPTELSESEISAEEPPRFVDAQPVLHATIRADTAVSRREAPFLLCVRFPSSIEEGGPLSTLCAAGSMLGSVAAPNRQLHLGLLADGSSSSRLRELGTEPIEEEGTEGGLSEGGLVFSFHEDVLRMKEIFLTKVHFLLRVKRAGFCFELLLGTQLLLLFAPLGLWSGMGGLPVLFVFISNFMTLIPLSALLGAFTEELSLHTGEITGGLLNATFGNAVEMIMSVQALRIGLLEVVQGTLLGSILSNLLLVLGMSFFAGGLRHYVQKFNEKGATCSVTLLLLSCMGIVIPTVAAVDNGQHGTYDILMQVSAVDLQCLNVKGRGRPIEFCLQISRVTALLIGVTYCLFLFFQLYTHIGLFKDDEDSKA